VYIPIARPAAMTSAAAGLSCCFGLGQFSLSSTLLGMPAGVVLGGGALLAYMVLFGRGARGRRGAMSEETKRHKKEVARIRREHPRL